MKTVGSVYIIPLVVLAVLATGCAFVDEVFNNGNGIFLNDTTPPTINSTIPSNGENNVSLNRSIEVFFSEAMDKGSVEGSFSIDPNISGIFTWGNDSKTLIFTPYSSFAPQTTYTVTISKGAKDSAGNASESDYVWSFTTGTDYDTTPPDVSFTDPVYGAIDVAVNSAISVTFTEVMDASSITTATFKVNDGYADISGSVAYSGTTATFTPAIDLNYSATYTATVTTGVKDSAGNALGADYVWSFTTGIEPDTTPPDVSFTDPVYGAVDVAINSTISVTFTEVMDPSSITTATFKVNDGSTDISGSVTYAGTTANFTPLVDLDYSTIYTVTVTTGVKDSAGHTLVSDYIWNFTTGADTTAPIPGNSGTISVSNVTDASVTLNWTKANDNLTLQSNLQYRVYFSESSNIDSVSNTETYGTMFIDWTTDIDFVEVTGLSMGTTYYFNVIVRDGDGNKASYIMTSQTTITILDAFVPNYEQSSMGWIWQNDGYGTFTDSGQVLGFFSSTGVSLGDLDGDGDIDAFVSNQNAQPNMVWYNDGNGNYFDSGQMLGSEESKDVVLGDLDGDGDLDAFVTNYNQPNKVWLNNGNGIFSDSGQTLGSLASQGFALGDLDGDGDLDAFVTNYNQPNKVWLNNGNGIFSDSGQALGNLISKDAELGDLDGDGDLDAFVVNDTQPNTVWINNGSGYFNNSGQTLGSSCSEGVALGDLDNDGDLDAFVANSASQPNRVWLNNGNGTFISSGQIIGSFITMDVALGDLDGDGDLDAFNANFSSQGNQVWYNDGTGIFPYSGPVITGSCMSVALGKLR